MALLGARVGVGGRWLRGITCAPYVHLYYCNYIKAVTPTRAVEIMTKEATRAKLQATASRRSMVSIIPSYSVSWRLRTSHCSLHFYTNCSHNPLVPTSGSVDSLESPGTHLVVLGLKGE